jgi:hypothetical protein
MLHRVRIRAISDRHYVIEGSGIVEISDEGLATGCTGTSTDPSANLMFARKMGTSGIGESVRRPPDKQSLLGMSGHAQST